MLAQPNGSHEFRFKPSHCPKGWRAVTGRRSAALICLPDSLLARLPDPAGRPGLPPGECPDGWRRVTPPLNPVLGCLPNNLMTP
jgi:hypothetical protein